MPFIPMQALGLPGKALLHLAPELQLRLPDSVEHVLVAGPRLCTGPGVPEGRAATACKGSDQRRLGHTSHLECRTRRTPRRGRCPARIRGRLPLSRHAHTIDRRSRSTAGSQPAGRNQDWLPVLHRPCSDQQRRQPTARGPSAPATADNAPPLPLVASCSASLSVSPGVGTVGNL